MAIETTSSNSALLQSVVQQLVIQPLEQASSFLNAGPLIIDSNKPVRIPRITAGATASFVAEGAQIGDGSVTWDEVDALPSTLKGIKVWLPLSNELLRTSAVDGLNSVLQSRLLTDISMALDAALYDGAGTSNTIKGIFQQSGIATGTLDLTDADSLIDGLATAQENFVNPSHWVMTAATFAALRKLKVSDSDNRYIFDPNGSIQNGTAFQLLGLPVVITSHIPNVSSNARAALVDFSKVAVVRDTDANVFISTERLADFDSVAIRVTLRMDVALLQPHAVTLLTTAS
jgi:HK97 family phage major capsid protein